MPKTTALSAAAPGQASIPVGKDWPVVMNHLRTLTKLPWTPETSNALGQFVANITGHTHSGLHDPKHVPKTPAPAGGIVGSAKNTHGSGNRKRTPKGKGASNAE